MKILYIVSFLIGTIVATKTEPKCCSGENVMVHRTCLDGNPIILTCDDMFIVPDKQVDDAGFIIDKEGNFSTDDDSFTTDEYCHTELKRDEQSTPEKVYIICYTIEEQALQLTEARLQVAAILGFISVLFIILTIAVYFAVPSLLDIQGKCIVHSLTGLGFGYLILGIIQLSSGLSVTFCQLLPFLMYPSFIYAFFWLNILSFHIWRTVKNPRSPAFSERVWILLYHLFGIGGTGICLLILLIAHFSKLPEFDHIIPGFGQGICWFRSLREAFIYFYGPISVLLFLNLFFYIWTVIILWQQMRNCNENKLKVLKYRLKLSIKLFFIMGLMWIFEVLSAALENVRTLKIIWIILDAINGLEGFFIFLILVVFRKRVRKRLANKQICNFKLPQAWRKIKDEEDEEEEIEEELSLSGICREKQHT